ncbi:hypothetical protein [Aquimarina agarilytica]|uniref:hypothetical protein n=1 Tax=Aquimarina agarilytica TaxID=1087449 RepID=UPI000288BBC8|nr:hypothetical protein [Aquimarina agarilytica]
MSDRKGWKLGEDSSMKMIVWFKDGNVRTMYSIDWKHKFSKQKDQQLGMQRFKKLIKKYGVLAGTIAIYDKQSGEVLAKFYEGDEKSLAVENSFK